jgi:hypothetical protein
MPEYRDGDTQHQDLAEQLSDAVASEIGSFVKLELAAEQMLEDEALLVGAYLKDDVRQAQSYLADLKSELLLLESRAGHWLLGAANPTARDWLQLQRHISHGEQLAMADEVMEGGRLQCLACRAVTRIKGTVTLAPCQACGCDVFQTLTAH